MTVYDWYNVVKKWEEIIGDAKEQVLNFGSDEEGEARILGSLVSANSDVGCVSREWREGSECGMWQRR